MSVDSIEQAEETINSLNEHNNLLKEEIRNITAEKISIDQVLVETLRQLIAARKEIVILNESLRTADQQLRNISNNVNIDMGVATTTS